MVDSPLPIREVLRSGLATLAEVCERRGMHLCCCLRCRAAVWAVGVGKGRRLMQDVPEPDADAFDLEDHRCVRSTPDSGEAAPDVTPPPGLDPPSSA